MPPLSSARRVERERPAAPAARVGAPRAARARGMSGSRRGQGPEWSALPTMMTCRGQGGKTYQIPIAPPPADHELIGVYGSAPASIEYTHQSLELTTSVMGMLQRSLDLLTIYGIPAPFQIPAAGGAPAGPSVSTRGAGRARRETTVHPRTKVGRTHVGSSSRAPIPNDNESEAEAEAESSEDETGDGSGSGSDGGAGNDASGPSSRKRTRTDSRA